MKIIRNIMLISLLFTSLVYAETELVERNGLYFKKYSNKPYSGTGIFKGIFIPTFTPDAYVKIKVLKGKLNGQIEVYNVNSGNLTAMVNFKNGKREGKEILYNKYGQIIAQLINKNDENCEGWFKNGYADITFKNCKKTGIDIDYKNDKKYEVKWKNGKIISKKEIKN